MLMTEAEARERVHCPKALAALEVWVNEPDAQGGTRSAIHIVTANRDGNGRPLPQCRCLGSDCMAWRWGEPGIGHRRGVSVTPPSDDYERQGDYFVRVRESCRCGYCGDFDKPEVA